MTAVFQALLSLAIMLVCGGAAHAAEMAANGIFLIAKREMRDPRFQQTVVLITQPPEGGPLGVVINRPLDQLLSEVLPDQAMLKGKKEVLYYGGPVAPGGLLFLVRTSTPPTRSIHVLKDVYFTGDVKWIEQLLRRADPTQGLRVFSGYSGWAAGQLQNEIQRGDWHMLPADAETIFHKDAASIWPELIKRATSLPTRAIPERSHQPLAISLNKLIANR